MSFTPTVLTDAYIVVNSNVISDHGNKVEVPYKFENLDSTTFGQTAHGLRAGLASGNLNISFLNDFTAANLDSIIWALLGTVVSFEIRPTSSARSTSNPAYTGNILVDSWTPVVGQVGQLVQVDVSWPTSGTVSRQTS